MTMPGLSGASTQTLVIPLTAKTVQRLSPNGRGQVHWVRTKERERVMETVRMTALAQRLRPMREVVRVTFRWVVPDRRARDLDNLAASGCVKATLDSLVKGEWLVDDSTRYVSEVRTEVVYEKGRRALVVILEAA